MKRCFGLDFAAINTAQLTGLSVRPTPVKMAAQSTADILLKEPLNKLISFMVRQSQHERNQSLAVRPALVDGLNQRFLKYS